MREAVFLLPSIGESLAAGDTTIMLKATGETTGGSFFMSDSTIEPGFRGPPPHFHEKLHDMFYVLDGTLTMLLDGETREAPAGTFVCVPPGVVHTFSNASEKPVRFLNLNTPAGWEGYMRELAAAAAEGPLRPETIGQIASKYDFVVA